MRNLINGCFARWATFPKELREAVDTPILRALTGPSGRYVFFENSSDAQAYSDYLLTQTNRTPYINQGHMITNMGQTPAPEPPESEEKASDTEENA